MITVSDTSPVSNLAMRWSLREEVARLQTEAHFWISAEFEVEFLADAGE